MVADTLNQEQVLDTEPNSPQSKKVNPEVLKAYEKCQQKYMEVYGKFLVRRNFKRRMKLKARIIELEARLKQLEANLYLTELNNERQT